ncbi:MAG: hypothetical protein R2832_15020 [Rhodothermales bacterium]
MRPETLSYLGFDLRPAPSAGVAASVLVLLSLLGAAIGTSWQANIAAHERDRARDRFDAVYAPSNTMLLDLHVTPSETRRALPTPVGCLTGNEVSRTSWRPRHPTRTP